MERVRRDRSAGRLQDPGRNLGARLGAERRRDRCDREGARCRGRPRSRRPRPVTPSAPDLRPQRRKLASERAIMRHGRWTSTTSARRYISGWRHLCRCRRHLALSWTSLELACVCIPRRWPLPAPRRSRSQRSMSTTSLLGCLRWRKTRSQACGYSHKVSRSDLKRTGRTHCTPPSVRSTFEILPVQARRQFPLYFS